ncbi:hypothetical protein CEUSTIGMA_g9626.t1 [Chlamydomonas eustigma]|uniref:Helitron helicase-like domain-containing protein n=1 Tax=Chlamydomonas eustigma TaxID=1157962 RepID=A0A250XGJ7_9CHLO|nr:hypothetical protein CEUSTIGMA_g9626.t1 [Chlamydomonas eustigma]|eukprot:GAX82198.1 hypothetical protein CEUSTIGMA_g9626.t1 [Chlamydomonas eustigma]
MFQLRQSVVTVNSIYDRALESEMAQLRREKPHSSDADDIMAHITKYKIPGNVSGSPSWFRERLANLLAVVDKHGMPNLFLTLTADEHSETRWPEIEGIEEILKNFSTEFTWKDAPVEMSKLFCDRIKGFMDTYVLCDHLPGPGSTQLACSHHARWSLAENDKYKAGNEVSGCMPGILDEYNQTWVVPDMFKDILTKEDRPGTRGRFDIQVDDLPDEVQEWVSDEGFHELHTGCVGARVMITDNMPNKPECVNGALGVVTKVELKDSQVFKIQVRLEATSTRINITRSNEANMSFCGKTYYKRAFPLTLAYAITGNKVLSTTYNNDDFK